MLHGFPLSDRPFAGGVSGPTREVAVRVARSDTKTSSFAFVPELFDGAAYGSTAETAVRQAIGDAEVTASAYGLYTCELAEEPEVFPRTPSALARAFRLSERPSLGAGSQDPGWARRPAKRFHKIVNGADVSGPAGIAIRKREPSETAAQSPCERGI
jgi:hypothetical protein